MPNKPGKISNITKEQKGVFQVDILVSGHKYYKNYGLRIEEQLERGCRY